MNEKAMQEALRGLEAKQREGSEMSLERRQAATRTVILNLIKDIEIFPTTAQDVVVIYSEIVLRLRNELSEG